VSFRFSKVCGRGEEHENVCVIQITSAKSGGGRGGGGVSGREENPEQV
jgi:hypothetical protein